MTNESRALDEIKVFLDEVEKRGWYYDDLFCLSVAPCPPMTNAQLLANLRRHCQPETFDNTFMRHSYIKEAVKRVEEK